MECIVWVRGLLLSYLREERFCEVSERFISGNRVIVGPDKGVPREAFFTPQLRQNTKRARKSGRCKFHSLSCFTQQLNVSVCLSVWGWGISVPGWRSMNISIVFPDTDFPYLTPRPDVH